MIRGPILPQARAHLWSLVKSRLDRIECGLELVREHLDCSEGEHGVLDGLCRDASGAPVLVALAQEEDPMLVPRILAAADFLERTGESLAEAIPEGNYQPATAPRLIVIGSEASTEALRALARLGLSRLELCRLEPFRLADTERFAVRWLAAAESAGMAEPAPSVRGTLPTQGDAPGEEGSPRKGATQPWQNPLWLQIASLCDRLDPAVRVEEGRFRQRISWCGRPLGQVTALDGVLQAASADGLQLTIESPADVHTFGARLMRCFARLAGLTSMAPAPARSERSSRSEGEALAMPRVPGDRTFTDRRPSPAAFREGSESVDPASADLANGSRSIESHSLRTAVSAAQLSPEEFAALAEPTESGRPKDPPN